MFRVYTNKLLGLLDQSTGVLIIVPVQIVLPRLVDAMKNVGTFRFLGSDSSILCMLTSSIAHGQKWYVPVGDHFSFRSTMHDLFKPLRRYPPPCPYLLYLQFSSTGPSGLSLEAGYFHMIPVSFARCHCMDPPAGICNFPPSVFG
jgi:hypothetical protein